MADNVTINPGAGGSTIACDDISGIQYQRVKLIYGGDGTNSGDVSSTNPYPVVERKPSSSSVSSVSGSASSVSLLASNANRLGATFFNDSTAVLYLKLGATASTTSYTTQLGSFAYYELPFPIYTGAIDGIWASATGAVRITELS